MPEILSAIVYYPFVNVLNFFIWATPGHYAAAGIALLTILVRLVLIVPYKKGAQSQRRMMQLQPLLDELKKEYAGDQQGLAAAQMELYKKNNINPFSSCGSLLLQLPVLYLLYYTIQHGLVAHNPHLYGWLPKPEFINTAFFGIDLLKPDKTFILPIIASGLQLIQVKMTLPPKSASSNDAQQATQRMMMYLAPALTLYISYRLEAGVAVYWIVTNLFSIVQQYYVNKERLSLTGVEKVVEAAEKAHPEAIAAMEKAEAEVLGTEVKKGVQVTVRKKSKK
ncbi:MAG: YidC/Oxa1 family membrane protein insertase [bacterium]